MHILELYSHVKLYPNYIYKLSPKTNVTWEIPQQPRMVTLPNQAIETQKHQSPSQLLPSAAILSPVTGRNRQQQQQKMIQMYHKADITTRL